MKLLLISIILLVVAVSGITIRILLIKNDYFKGTCSSNNPLLEKGGIGCACSAK
ncbi:membrane or secreted protein [Flavobacterium chilense]|uniref:Membrane or secreted protein n=1 Tax=Flavobacterium chilense TaxID=946677 RepID=A0A1M7MDX8_9FLAO|nr:membrane or secreted protein [Flavobacterium chilense]SHM89034.1 hypothetical protein SAMN05444484_11249 [Flavobacterium chilense]